jgi:3-dehydroquinate dehydratase II
MRVLILNGPNLDRLGQREPHIYGDLSFERYLPELRQRYAEHAVDLWQSNVEGDLINMLGKAEREYDAVILNPAGYSHTSVAIRDTIAAMDIPVVEVHISNIHGRESFRHTSLTGSVSKGVISGLGIDGYRLALEHLLHADRSKHASA